MVNIDQISLLAFYNKGLLDGIESTCTNLFKKKSRWVKKKKKAPNLASLTRNLK